MSFVHGKTGYTYYSVNEKLNYYKKMINNPRSVSSEDLLKAKKRISELEKLKSRSFEEPTLIVTNDKHFKNGISKPRVAVVVDKDAKGKLIIASVNKRTTDSIVLDRTPDRQVDSRITSIDRSEVYETKYVSNLNPLTEYDKIKMNNRYKKKQWVIKSLHGGLPIFLRNSPVSKFHTLANHKQVSVDSLYLV